MRGSSQHRHQHRHRRSPLHAPPVPLPHSVGAVQASGELHLLRSRVVPAVGQSARKQLQIIEEKLEHPGSDRCRTTPAMACFVPPPQSPNPHFVPTVKARVTQQLSAHYSGSASNLDHSTMRGGSTPGTDVLSGLLLFPTDASVTSRRARRAVHSPRRIMPASHTGQRGVSRPLHGPQARAAPRRSASTQGLRATPGAPTSASAPAQQPGMKLALLTEPRARRRAPSLGAALLVPCRANRRATAQSRRGATDDEHAADSGWYADVVLKVQRAWASSLFGDPLANVPRDTKRDKAIFQPFPTMHAFPGEAEILARRFGHG